MRSVPAGYQIGRPRPHELASLPAIEVEAAAVFPREDLTLEARGRGLPLSFFEEVASAGSLWGARTIEPAAPVGFAAVMMLDGTPHLYEMDVLPEHGRRGLGRALVLHVARWARVSGFVSVTLTTFRHLSWNAPFYASVGFAEIPDPQLGSELRAAMAEEAGRGLASSKRVAMRLALVPA